MPSASAYASPTSCGLAAAMPLARNAVTFSRCQVSRSSRTQHGDLGVERGCQRRRSRPIVGPGRTAGSCTFLTWPRPATARQGLAAGRAGRRRGAARALPGARLPAAHPRHLDAAAGRHRRGRATTSSATSTRARDPVTLLPPHVPHDGRGATAEGFRKRVVYLEPTPSTYAGRPGGRPTRAGATPRCARAVHLLHEALRAPRRRVRGREPAGARRRRLERHLARPPGADRRGPRPGLARGCATCSTRTWSTGSRLATRPRDARRPPDPPRARLPPRVRHCPAPLPHRPSRSTGAAAAAGRGPPAEVAAAVGFHDQSHLTRHFKRLLGVTPGAFAASA